MSVMANDPSRFDGEVQAFANASASLRREYETLRLAFDALNGMWTGEAHDELASRFDGDYTNLESVVHHLEGMASSLRNTLVKYQDCERNVSTAIDDLSF